MDRIKLIIDLLPILIALIKSVEAAIPEKGQGSTKLAMIREILTTIDENTPTVWPVLETAINAIVKTFNLTGVFKR